MFRKFIGEEKAQTGIEYILLAGGIIVATVVILSIYSSMGSSTATKLNQSVGEKISEIENAINNTAV